LVAFFVRMQRARAAIDVDARSLQLRWVLVVFFSSLCLAAHSAPGALSDACYVRPEPLPSTGRATVAAAVSQSQLGLRRKTTQLFDVELTVVDANAAVCTVTGVARLRNGPGGEVLVLPVRPAAAGGSHRGTAPCLVSIRATPDAVEIATTEAACQAQALCDGQVRLQGQRFELNSRLAQATGGPCFARPAP
jgi:hypothetical protein